MRVVTRRLLEEQIAVVVVLESGKKDDAMWHVPHHDKNVVFITHFREKCSKQNMKNTFRENVFVR